ncbi:MAG: DNA topoisomerase (ATP-hydrolyzing) subunit B [Candidatus Phytoplasma stylosanthis]|uniref:DNA topoisomerase (ATP-hydrolyzing) subunit B n=1 Tax=Candidatus Phytoplasma stylosanthis TaxID=2798314 RepID=UPI00293A4156|nr:DNA topoisomerase (ATP-hydrolyzing) subunit B [Candidatus Phytoplasma stylosanthis]MDV3167769.1 DNA topoisomerase (ATP-hydrolyzing) subunit B [Candidatus Phytoplasma stylosanthis]MDV3170954.1 DNA topoisomerase (ATP-hydrolyzing) subunit B [Candidatus Phytoplasma stylosanthis]MDV3173533.1 DNA topoisomerase (ATP-hydrolyzing) subunit B [Candidatus Phytoplasma stylosanthis]MDV3174126.1 DNA topoisomerase (ATP-hydrolyzing) subunit B [Candidatus Phytoplasma stylosanthis]MDV3202354.1 DNA topoisomera
MINNKKYNADSIQILEGLEAVRMRPGMYIGSTSEKGLYHLVWEIIDNSIDEALEGFASEITLEILDNNVIRISDDGRGIPVDIHPKTNKPAVETILTTLHAGGKFDKQNYQISGGLHGVGASVVNALSSWFSVEIHINNEIYFQMYEKGIPITPLEKKGVTQKRGTIISFTPDPAIFENMEKFRYKLDVLKERIQQISFLNKKIKLNIIDQTTQPHQEFHFHYKNGIKEYIEYLNKNKKNLNNIFYKEYFSDDFFYEIAFQYSENYSQNIYSFVNNIPTKEGGTHEEGFKIALNRILNKYAKDKNILKKETSLISEDTLEGILVIISLKHPNPLFEGQTKNKLGNPEIRQFISKTFGDVFETYLLENPHEAKKIIEKCLLAMKARIAAKKAREITRKKTSLELLNFNSKLTDCYNKDPKTSELYIVEGDSAGGSAKQGRDSRFQAILPLRGKIINVEKSNLAKVLSNNEIISLIQAIGTGIDKEFDLSKARYNRIIIMTDADVDGAHIRTLLLTFFFRNLKPLIENGYIYFAQPPLYKVVESNKEIKYFYNEKEYKKYQTQLQSKNKKISSQRYKGLGEMNPEQLWETTMDPKKRTLLKIHLEDIKEANEVFDKLMGKLVDQRKEFIEQNAYKADIDI